MAQYVYSNVEVRFVFLLIFVHELFLMDYIHVAPCVKQFFG